jgi:AcrR family transcriptional regulator
MARAKRMNQQTDLQEAIKETAWKQIAEFGAPTLSLRAIARELGITAPAIYNYFPRRDDLVTALIIDAYTSLGDSQFEARDAVSAEDLVGRMFVTGMAYRSWALDYPQRYQLIFGTPIPGYQAPVEKVMPSSIRSLSVLVSVLDALRVAGRLNTPDFPEIQPEFKAGFEMWKSFDNGINLTSLSVAFLVWARVHGIVSLEISHNLPPFGTDGNALYKYELMAINRQFIKE